MRATPLRCFLRLIPLIVLIAGPVPLGANADTMAPRSLAPMNAVRKRRRLLQRYQFPSSRELPRHAPIRHPDRASAYVSTFYL